MIVCVCACGIRVLDIREGILNSKIDEVCLEISGCASCGG